MQTASSFSTSSDTVEALKSAYADLEKNWVAHHHGWQYMEHTNIRAIPLRPPCKLSRPMCHFRAAQVAWG